MALNVIVNSRMLLLAFTMYLACRRIENYIHVYIYIFFFWGGGGGGGGKRTPLSIPKTTTKVEILQCVPSSYCASIHVVHFELHVILYILAESDMGTLPG